MRCRFVMSAKRHFFGQLTFKQGKLPAALRESGSRLRMTDVPGGQHYRAAAKG